MYSWTLHLLRKCWLTRISLTLFVSPTARIDRSKAIFLQSTWLVHEYRSWFKLTTGINNDRSMLERYQMRCSMILISDTCIRINNNMNLTHFRYLILTTNDATVRNAHELFNLKMCPSSFPSFTAASSASTLHSHAPFFPLSPFSFSLCLVFLPLLSFSFHIFPLISYSFRDCSQ